MAIQKFKYGQEITSAKLNEIVSFLNTLETALNNTQYWNNSVDNKISGFTTQLNALKTQVTSVLGSADTLDSIRQQIAVIEAQYASLIEENVTTILTDLFDNVSITAPDVNGVSYWVINNEVTTIKAGIKGDTGDTGATGAAGANGTNGTNGNTILTGSLEPTDQQGVLGDIYLNFNNYNLHKKETVNNVVKWVLKANTRGTTGPTGKSTRIEFGFKDFDGQSTLNSLPGVATKYLSFRTYEVTSVGSFVPNSYSQYYTVKIRGDRWFPKLTTSGDAVNLEWILDDGNSAPSLAAVNIRGPQGPQGPAGPSGNNFIVKGIVSSDANLPLSGVAGDAYMVGASAPYAVYIWNLNKAGGAGWSSIGTGIVGPTGATGPAGAAGQNGATGQRGNKIFAITTLPTVSPYNDLGLITNDIFINKDTGLISEITAVTDNVPTYADVVTLPIVDELVFETQIKAIEPLAIGDVVQFAGVHGGQKLVAKATPFSGKEITFQNTAYPIANFNLQPEVIMGISRTTVASAGNAAQIMAFGYINNWPEESLSLTSNDVGKILYVKSEGTLEADRGKLATDRPVDKTKVTLPIAAFIATSGNNLLVRSWISATVAGDVAGLSALLDEKVTKNNNITAATKTKITYDAKGLVTAGTDIVAGDITSGTFAIGQIPTGTTNTTVSLGNHTHGNLSSDGKIGANTVSGRLVMTTTNGALTTQDRYTTVYTTGTPLQVTSATLRDLTLTTAINKHEKLKITWSTLGTGSDYVSEVYIHSLTTPGSDGIVQRISYDMDPVSSSEGKVSFSIQLGTTVTTSSSTIRISNPFYSSYSGTLSAISVYISKIERINF
jgi:hypothetical protein